MQDNETNKTVDVHNNVEEMSSPFLLEREELFDFDDIVDINFDIAVKSELGIEDSDSWKNLPFSVNPISDSGILPAAANKKVIVFFSRGECLELTIFNRKDFTYKTVRMHCENGGLDCYNIRNCVLIDDDTLYWIHLDTFYVTDINTGNTRRLNKLDKDLFYRVLLKVDGPTKVVGIVEKEYDDYLGYDIQGSLYQLPKEFAGCNVCVSGDNKLLMGYKGVLDLGESEFTPLFAYAFSLKNSDLDSMKEMADEFNRNIYAVDLASHTVTVRDFRMLTKEKYKEGSLIAITKEGIRRVKHRSVPDSFERDVDFHSCCKPYRDCIGHVVGVDGNYDVIYKRQDDSYQSLFHTLGSCVPEGFKMVDNHTAVVKIEDGKVAIVDFAENCKYILPVPC